MKHSKFRGRMQYRHHGPTQFPRARKLDTERIPLGTIMRQAAARRRAREAGAKTGALEAGL